MDDDLLAGLLASSDSHKEVTESYDLSQLSTYRVGGIAKFFTRISDLTSLEKISKFISKSGIKVLIVGNGSNLLISDSGFNGLVIQLGEDFENISIKDQVVTAGGAVNLPILARHTAKNGLSGLEWAVGVPGSVGGGVRMNAGGHGASISDSLLSANVFDLLANKYKELDVDELKMEYRSTVISNHEIVIEAKFSLDAGKVEKSDERISEIVKWRRENQPGGQNAGSVFMNPLGDSAGRLIDAAGLKGHKVGSAMVSEKHANFIQVEPNGSAEDVYELMKVVHSRVLEETGVHLETETVMVGFDRQ